MPLDAHSEERLREIHPALAAKIRTMAEMLEQEGITIRVVQGLRSWSQQLALWLKGRDARGNVVDTKKVVTRAAPGHSYHQFGLAVDLCPFENNIPDWNANHNSWKRMIAVGESLGLTAGAEWRSFPDNPHFQLTGTLPVSPTDEARQAFMAAGQQAVWELAGMEV